VNTTQGFPDLLTFWDDTSYQFNINSSAGVNGYELNFWMKPEMTTNTPNTTYFMNFLQLIPIRYQLYLSPTQTLGHCVYFTYGGKTPNATLNLNGFQWMNVNLQVQFLSYI
jgi:hypothetical protein